MKDRVPALPTNDLRKTKGAYVQEAVKKMNEATDGTELLSSGQKYKKAMEMWMESATRAALMSGKSPKFTG